MKQKPAYPGIPDVINGNGAVAYVMRHVCGGVIGFPITPSTEISEIFEAARAEGAINVWGKHPFFVEAEGEHSAQSGALGAALLGGNFISNASSAQGILYALESHYVTAYKTIGGFVLHVAARVVTRHSLNVMAGHDDVYSLLPAGYTVLFGSDPQETADLAAIAYRATSLTLVPIANAMDGFATSHVMSEVLLPEPELLKNYIGDPLGRIPCPTVAQEVLFGAKGRVDYLSRWVDARRDALGGDNVAAVKAYLAANADAIEADNEAALAAKAALPEAQRAAWKRAWKGAWQKGSRQRVPAIVDPNNPGLTGTVQNQPDFQAGAADHRTHFTSAVPQLVRQAMEEYSSLTGRSYAPVHKYGAKNADVALIGLGSITHDARALLPYFEKQGLKVAVISVKLLAPFPTEELVAAIGNARQVTILERSEDTQLTYAVKRALFESGASSAKVTLTTAIIGLGSHDVQPRDIVAVVQNMLDGPKAPLIYVGTRFFVDNPATPALAALQDRLRAAYPETELMTLATGDNPPGLLPAAALRIRFHSVGGYGTVATGKLLTDMLASMLKMHSKSAPKYGSEKSGAATNFYITLSPEPVLFTNNALEDVEVVISPDHKVFEHDRPLRGLVPGGTFIMQTDQSPLAAWKALPPYARQEIRDKNIHFFVIDAFAVAKANAPDPSLETRMMGIAFIGAIIGHVDRVTGGADHEAAKKLARKEMQKKFGAKGSAVVDANMAVIEDAIEHTQAVDYSQPEYAKADAAATIKTPILSARLMPSAGCAPCGLHDPAYFDDMAGRPFREGWANQAPALPGMGTFIPSGTGAAKNKGLFRRNVPVVDIDACTACLECALACPDSAIPNQAHEIAVLLERAIRAAQLQDEHKNYLLGFAPAWADKARAALSGDAKDKKFADVVRAAAGVIPSVAPDHLEAIIAEIAAFPVGRPRPIFDLMEKKEAGSGGMYSVVIDPWKCTGCLQCVEVCGPGALTAVAQDEALLETLEGVFARLTQLPNTPSRFMAGAASPGGDAKRILMDHNSYYGLTGGHGACRGCGEVTATHLLTALAETAGAEKKRRRIGELESLIYQLTSKVGALKGERAERIRATIAQLEASLWTCEAGSTGRGPSSLVVVNSTGCSSVYSSTFPANPFTQPWLNSLFQDAQASAVGIFEGLVTLYITEVKARRTAALELADAYDEAADKALATLDWRDFSNEELDGLPMVLTISGDGAAFDIGFGALSRVLASQAPIKMLVLDTGGYSNTGGQASMASFTGQNADLARFGKAHKGKKERRKELALMAMLHPDVFVASVSTAQHAHFFAAAARLIAYPSGSGLLLAYTPCGFEQGFADDLANQRADLAMRSRMAPLFVHDPAAGKTLTERLSLDGNPDLDQPWATQNLKYVDESGATQVMTLPFTPADFAYGEIRFALHFKALADDAPTPTPVVAYVDLPEEARAERTPYILTTNAAGRLIKLSVSQGIVDLVEDRQRNWQLLRWLAGRDAALTARDAQQALQALRDDLAEARAERDKGIDDIAHALAALATSNDPGAVTIPGFGVGVPVVAAPAATPAPAVPAASAAASGRGSKPAGAPIWLAEQDIAKCSDCATCYQELPAIFEQTTIVVDGEAKDVAHMKPGALDGLEITPTLTATMERVRDTCDSEIMQ
ncbi:MAG: 2-oxoacid:acceptor oxidoreductase family protein [Betaproteobacteria bacterium]|nr:2-oxoacid:acceptor oxidoreductase family protein [Betaproteobacteria bacterium]MCL2885248.1 2-oxoacid:acceptor oxidoreductase family protein [Betaproteobacteria bacterium]